MILLHFMSEPADLGAEYVIFLDTPEISEVEALEYARPGFNLVGAWTIRPERALSNLKMYFLPGDGDVYLRD